MRTTPNRSLTNIVEGRVLALVAAICLPQVSLAQSSPDLAASTPGARATTSSEERVLYDFNGHNLLVYGIYSAKIHGKKNGVDAEFTARREGKQAVSDHLASICKGSELNSEWQERVKPRKDWSPTSLTSQGSEIFPEASLLIRLQSPFSSIFSRFPSTKVNPIQNSAKEEFVFKTPAIPAILMRCGSVELRVSPTRVINVSPGYANKIPSGATIITLAVTKERLEPATASDAAALKRSELGIKQDPATETANTPILLPLVYGTQE